MHHNDSFIQQFWDRSTISTQKHYIQKWSKVNTRNQHASRLAAKQADLARLRDASATEILRSYEIARQNAAISIQRWWRSFRTASMHPTPLQNSAARLIQMAFRKYKRFASLKNGLLTSIFMSAKISTPSVHLTFVRDHDLLSGGGSVQATQYMQRHYAEDADCDTAIQPRLWVERLHEEEHQIRAALFERVDPSFAQRYLTAWQGQQIDSGSKNVPSDYDFESVRTQFKRGLFLASCASEQMDFLLGDLQALRMKSTAAGSLPELKSARLRSRSRTTKKTCGRTVPTATDKHV